MLLGTWTHPTGNKCSPEDLAPPSLRSIPLGQETTAWGTGLKSLDASLSGLGVRSALPLKQHQDSLARKRGWGATA